MSVKETSDKVLKSRARHCKLVSNWYAGGSIKPIGHDYKRFMLPSVLEKRIKNNPEFEEDYGAALWPCAQP